MAPEDTEEALGLMEKEQRQQVLLDLMLPDTDGINLMLAILSLSEVPVIFLLVCGREEIVCRALDLGAADYVVKPFSPTELAARIGAALRRRAVSGPRVTYAHED